MLGAWHVPVSGEELSDFARMFPALRYEVRVPTEDQGKLDLEHPEQADIFCVVRAAERIEEFTVNLRGPLVVHAANKLGRQIINEAADYGVRQPLFSEVALAQVEPSSPAAPVAATGV